MGRLIDTHEIDEFREIVNVPQDAITEAILSEVRSLDERTHLEPLLRQILYDPGQTPHGPTEIADVLTTHLHLGSDRKLCAFVIKGRSYQRVSSRDVAHQLLRVRGIEGLDVLVLAAVGHVQDDARRDFFQVASDGAYDHLILDIQELARLLIAYGKLCPTDGTPFDDHGTCREGHALDHGFPIEINVREERQYEVCRLRDVSHGGAKRYSGTLLLDRHYSREVIREIIQEATEALRQQNYYRDQLGRSRWGDASAHVVWLFIGSDQQDVRTANWICRTQWIDPSLPEVFRPHPLGTRDRVGDILVAWNDSYTERRSFYRQSVGIKEQVVEALQGILDPMVKFARRAATLFDQYQDGALRDESYVSAMQGMQPMVRELYLRSGDMPSPPQDCVDYDQACEELFAIIDNMFLYHSEEGLQRWTKDSRDWLMRREVGRFWDQLKRVEFEQGKLH